VISAYTFTTFQINLHIYIGDQFTIRKQSAPIMIRKQQYNEPKYMLWLKNTITSLPSPVAELHNSGTKNG